MASRLGTCFAQPAGDLEMVLGLVPGPGDLVEVGPEGLLDDEGVGGKELEEGAAVRRYLSGAP